MGVEGGSAFLWGLIGKKAHFAHPATWLTRKKIIEIKGRKTGRDSEYYLSQG
jgi:hypothetical protein